MATKNERLLLLLDHLSAGAFRTLPQGAGLKTAIRAKSMGLIEWTGDCYRLTNLGEVYRRARRDS